MTLKEFWESTDCFGIREIEYEGCESFVGTQYSLYAKRLWFDNGLISIPIWKVDTYEELEQMCKEYLNGNFVCCTCGKVLKASDKKSYQKYFAGIYCNECWTPEQERDREIDYKNLY